LKGYWKMEDGSGTTLTDVSGYGNDGTIDGASWTTGISSTSYDNTPKTMAPGNALSFDGSNDYVSTANTSSLSGSGTASVQVWIYKTSDPAAGIILYHGSGAADGSNFAYQIYEVAGSDLIGFYIRTSNGSTGVSFDSNDISLNTWHQIVGVYDGSNLKSYLNGTLKGTSGSISGSTQSINNPLHIGQQYNGSYFAGVIDEVAIWNDGLSAAEVTALYNSGTALDARTNSGDYSSTADLKGYWKMEDGSGTKLTDVSGNGNDGTINGATWTTGVLSTSYDNTPK